MHHLRQIAAHLRRLGDQGPGPRIGQQAAMRLGAVGRVQGHHATARLEDPEIAGHVAQPVVGQQADPVADGKPARQQQVGQAVGLFLELGPRPLPVAVDQAHGVAAPVGGALEQAVQGAGNCGHDGT